MELGWKFPYQATSRFSSLGRAPDWSNQCKLQTSVHRTNLEVLCSIHRSDIFFSSVGHLHTKMTRIILLSKPSTWFVATWTQSCFIRKGVPVPFWDTTNAKPMLLPKLSNQVYAEERVCYENWSRCCLILGGRAVGVGCTWRRREYWQFTILSIEIE